MSEEDKKESGEITRREFLKDAGFIVGGAAIGAGIAYPLIPGTEKEVIVEVPGPTVEVPVDVLKYVCPFDGQEFASLSALTGHMEAVHPAEVQVITEFACPYDSQTFASLAALTSHVNTEHPPEIVEVPEELTKLMVNGETYELKVEPHWTLADVLRDALNLTGTKLSCDRGECGFCTVIMDNRPILSCMTLAVTCEGKNIETIEGLANTVTKELHPIQKAVKEHGGMQCSFCTPGWVMSAKALLDRNPKPTMDEVKVAVSGVLCRCGNYPRRFESVLAASK